jgi:hypothetical protein
MKDIFIVLIRPYTGLGSIARRFTNYEYTHIAVSLDKSLTEFVSYSRRYHSFPFDAGFAYEYRDYYAFGSHKSVKVKVFRLRVSDENYSAVTDFISRCENDDNEIFNLFSMATMPILHGFRIFKANNCMSFTAKVIELSGKTAMEKPYYRYSIADMDDLLSEYLYFEGKLRRTPSKDYENYMRPFSPMKYLSDMVKLLSKLSFRAVFMKNKI